MIDDEDLNGYEDENPEDQAPNPLFFSNTLKKGDSVAIFIPYPEDQQPKPQEESKLDPTATLPGSELPIYTTPSGPGSPSYEEENKIEDDGQETKL